MISNSSVNDAEDGYSSLLNESEPKRYCVNQTRRRQICIGVPCILFVMLTCGVFGYFVSNGAFSKVTRDVRIVNGTVIEPNTKIPFPVNRAVTLDGEHRVQRLIGVFLKTKHVPEIDATMHVFVEAAYVDRAEGRLELARYRNGVPHMNQEDKAFKEFVDMIANGKTTVTYEYVMVMATPGTQMHDHWLDSLVDLWKGWNAPPERIVTLKSCFSAWFLHQGFHNHDEIFIEFNSRNKVSRCVDNGKPLNPPCNDPMFGRAIVTHELYENGNLVADLLPTLWNTEYDNDFE